MSYTKTTWVTGDIVTAPKLNNIENGVYNNDQNISSEASTRATADGKLEADLAPAYSTSATYAVGDYCIYQGQLYRCTTAITTAEAWTAAHWSAVALGDDTRDLRSALSAIYDDDPIYIIVPSSGITEKLNTFVTGSVGGNPTENTNSNWRTMTMPVVGGKKYRVTARFYSSIKGVFSIDANNKIVQIDGSESADAPHTLIVTVPSTAVTMIINDKKSSTFKVEEAVEVINNDLIYVGNEPIDKALEGITGKIGALETDNVYTIGTGKMRNTVNLRGSQNGTFSYTRIYYDGNSFKGCDDDISPVNTDAGYIGANHGLYRVYEAKLSNHGLTVADIGKSCLIDGNTWVLLKVTSGSVFVVGCLDDNPYGVKTVSSAPTTFNFDRSITVTSISLAQLMPIVKNVNVAIAKNDVDSFEVAESYEIVSPSDGIAYIRAHIGENTNDTIIEQSEPIIVVRNLYAFANSGACAVTQNLKMLSNDIVLKFYGGTQSIAFGQSDYFSVPMTSNGTLSPVTQEVEFYRTTWDTGNVPPVVYCQTDAAINSANKMMVQGILMADRNEKMYSSGGFVYTTRKMYPYAVQPNISGLGGTTYNLVSFRLPCYKNEMSDKFEFCNYCKVGRAYYFFAFSSSAVSDSIFVPTELCGKKIETVMAENATCNNTLVADSIDVTSTGESYLLLKLTD